MPVIRSLPKQGGFSLAELMIALVAGLVVSGAVLSFFLSSMKSNGEFVQSTRLTQELRNSLNLITQDLERAGYDQDSLSYLASGGATPFTKIKLEVANSCVIYAYDRAGAGIGTLELSNGEVRAFRRATGQNQDGRTVGVIEYAVSAGTNRPTCTAAGADYTKYPPACNATTGWCPLSDPSVLDITTLTFTDNRSDVGVAPNRVQLRRIGVDLTGQIAGTTGATRNMVASVRVRSDCYNATLTNCSLTP
jgi:Tfp pilus assembly protein PilW